MSEENRDTMELWPEWEQVLFANVSGEAAQDNLNECVHELLEKAAKVGSGRVGVAKQMRTVLESRRTCASCPEMDNPDSYIVHLQSALKWHDEHVPRPTNPRNTCVVLMGQKPPEEVMFVREGGGVTHYLPEGACVNEWAESGKFKCSKCGLQVDSISTNTTAPMPIRHCPNCGRHLEVSDR